MEEHSAKHLAAIVESSFDAIISKDVSGTIVSRNKAAERMFGYPESDAVGKPIYLILPDDKRKEEVDILRRLNLGEGIDPFQTTRRHRDGRTIRIPRAGTLKNRNSDLQKHQLCPRQDAPSK